MGFLFVIDYSLHSFYFIVKLFWEIFKLYCTYLLNTIIFVKLYLHKILISKQINAIYSLL